MSAYAQSEREQNFAWCQDQYVTNISNSLNLQFQQMLNHDLSQSELDARLKIQALDLDTINETCNYLLGKIKN